MDAEGRTGGVTHPKNGLPMVDEVDSVDSLPDLPLLPPFKFGNYGDFGNPPGIGVLLPR